jgi:hypothetical protein
MEIIVEARALKTDMTDHKFNDRFMEFIKQFALIGKNSKFFPKRCRTCGKVFESFPEYIQGTSPRDHCLEDYSDVEGYGTVQYRNCRCGSTLIINFTEDVYPLLDRFWEMIGQEARRQGKPPREVVLQFREQCNRYIVGQHSKGSR